MRKSVMAGALVVAVLAIVATAVSFADEPLNVQIQGNPNNGSCICPAIWAPVTCKGEDGSKHHFSSLCVAGCYGYTKCAPIDGTLGG